MGSGGFRFVLVGSGGFGAKSGGFVGGFGSFRWVRVVPAFSINVYS